MKICCLSLVVPADLVDRSRHDATPVTQYDLRQRSTTDGQLQENSASIVSTVCSVQVAKAAPLSFHRIHVKNRRPAVEKNSIIPFVKHSQNS
jgi:hypothetical protein